MSFKDNMTIENGVAIRLKEVCKTFQIYEKPHHRLMQGLYRGRKVFFKEFHALNNISFDIKKGETVGIIGRNGAGKSTLLQIICGTMTQSSGRVEINGRIAALLELGAGFNPEFTGRENIYMNAAIIGLSTNEIDEKYSSIVEFADIGEFIEHPVKSYSSGMYVRLAFSVAINVEPDILIVDEALAVGDMLFQAKCMIRLKKMVDSGVTVLFVSHDTGTVKSICENCALLEDGSLVEYGKASDVVDLYIGKAHLEMNQVLHEKLENKLSVSDYKELTEKPLPSNFAYDKNNLSIVVSTDIEAKWPDTVHRYGDGGARILDIKLLDTSKNRISHLEVEQEFIIQISIRFDKTFPAFAAGYSIRDLKGQMLVGSVTTNDNTELPKACEGDVHIVEVHSSNKLREGIYTVSVGVELPVVLNQQHIFLDVIENAVVFESKFKPDPATWFPSMVKTPAKFIYNKVGN